MPHDGAKRWEFTLNNWTVHPVFDPSTMESLWFGEEVGDEGTPHLQGHVTLLEPRNLRWLKEWLPAAHFEVTRGTLAQSWTYCSKGGVFHHFGTKPKIPTLKESTSNIIAKLLLNNHPIHEIRQEYPGYYMLHRTKILAMAADISASNSSHHPRFVVWLYGDTGVGKTRFATELFPFAPICDYVEPFIHGYNLEKTVILDELRHDVPLRSLLRLTDRYRYTVNVKNGSLPWGAETIVITAPEPPEIMYCTDRGFAADNVRQLLRRLSLIVRLTSCDVLIHDTSGGERLSRDDGFSRLRTLFGTRNQLPDC